MQESIRPFDPKLLNLIIESCQKRPSTQVVVFPGEFFPGTLIDGFPAKCLDLIFQGGYLDSDARFLF